MKLKSAPASLRSAPSTLTFAATDERSLEARRRALQPSRAWYKTPEWQALRRETFRRDHYQCQMAGCGHVTSRPVCDHIKPHRGDRTLFFDPNNLQTMCKPCHDRLKQAIEAADR